MIWGFNSRTCEGATAAVWNEDKDLLVSIHAPVKVRRAHYDYGFVFVKFQFTHL